MLMDKYNNFLVIKSSGEEEPFSIDKYIDSLYKIGLNADEVKTVSNRTISRLYNKISTKKLYGITFNEIKKLSPRHASIYSLKECLRLMGPSGFPFEHFVSQLYIRQGFSIKRDQFIKGKCAMHEIDIIATSPINESELRKEKTTLVEVKFHVEFDHKSDIKVPLYVKARFDDIWDAKNYYIDNYAIITNTKFTINAINYSACAGVNLIAWGYPKNNSIEILIARYKLYPITVLHCLTDEEKRKLISNDVVLYEDLGIAKEKKLISESKLEEIYKEYIGLRS
jgi:Holliday junction resolvase-like predicted endonuclease